MFVPLISDKADYEEARLYFIACTECTKSSTGSMKFSGEKGWSSELEVNNGARKGTEQVPALMKAGAVAQKTMGHLSMRLPISVSASLALIDRMCREFLETQWYEIAFFYGWLLE